ncbi:MAG: efflux RND transporter periplasmic adaptor subunit [Oscillospiraceae bacterium]
MKKTTKRMIIWGSIIAIIAVGIGGCYYKASQFKPTVDTTSMKNREIENYLSISGIIKTGDTQDYVVTGSSQVKKVHVKNGDEVKKGDLLVEFDNSDAQDSYKHAAISYEKSRLSIDEAERNYFDVLEDIKQAEKDRDYSKEKMKEYEDYPLDSEATAKYTKYENAYETYKSRIEAMEKSIPSAEQLQIQKLSFEEAKMALDSAQKVIDRLPKNIYAENDGVVENLSVSDLRMVDRGTNALSIRTINSNIVEFSLGKYDLPKVSLGMESKVKFGATEYKGTITKIDNMADETSKVKAEITVENPDEKFIPAMAVDVNILTFSNKNAQTIPIEAVKTDKTGDYCYIIKETLNEGKEPTYKPEKAYITVGNSSDLFIEVLSGLNVDDIIAANPPAEIELLLNCTIKEIPDDALSQSTNEDATMAVTMTPAS